MDAWIRMVDIVQELERRFHIIYYCTAKAGLSKLVVVELAISA